MDSTQRLSLAEVECVMAGNDQQAHQVAGNIRVNQENTLQQGVGGWHAASVGL